MASSGEGAYQKERKDAQQGGPDSAGNMPMVITYLEYKLLDQKSSLLHSNILNAAPYRVSTWNSMAWVTNSWVPLNDETSFWFREESVKRYKRQKIRLAVRTELHTRDYIYRLCGSLKDWYSLMLSIMPHVWLVFLLRMWREHLLCYIDFTHT